MAKEPRNKATGNQSIVRHPLFPATVALWFGALFGLGSLAVRPGLLEAAVLATHLDAVIASAAPPLGATTRILVALFMAGAGGMLGARLARRIARPRPVVVPRKRGASAVGDAHKAARSPYYTSENTEAAAPPPGSGNRRRQLAMEEDQTRIPEYRDQVPVPGGSPQILDVSTFDLDGFESVDGNDLESATDQRPEIEGNWSAGGPVGPSPAIMTTSDFEPPSGAQVFQPTGSVGGESDPRFEARETPPSPAVSNGLFDAYSKGLGTWEAEEQPPFAAAPFSAPVSSAGEFSTIEQDLEPEPDFAPLPRFGAQETDPQWPDEPAQEQAPFQKSTLELEPAPRLFGETNAPAPFAPSPAQFDDEPLQPVEARPIFSAPEVTPPETEAPWAEASSHEPVQAAQDQPAETLPNSSAQGEGFMGHDIAGAISRPPMEQSAGERIESAELDDLSDVELLERLARTLQRRRGRSRPASEPSDARPTLPVNASVGEHVWRGEATPAAIAPPPVTIPAALRPIGLGDEDDDDLLPSYVPPRRIAMPLDDAARLDEVGDEPGATLEPDPAEDEAAPFATLTGPRQAEAEEENAIEESRVLEEGYSSLLDLSRQGETRQQFVRIEEPEFTGGQIEPVVIFPGQEPAGDAPFAKRDTTESQALSAPAAAQDQSGAQGAVRSAPFAPSPEVQQGPLAAPFAPPQKRQDPEETERALRTALATLQRMSGAA